MAVPNSFASATSTIPLANLDANFAYYDAAYSIAASTMSINYNLAITGTGNRITGDFSNATVASRVMFQTSTVNNPTFLYAIPNGTSQIAAVTAANSSSPDNSSWLDLSVNASEARIRSGINGTGTYLPMNFYTGGSERVRIDTSGNVGIGTSSPQKKFVVSDAGAVGMEWSPTDYTSNMRQLAYNRTTGAYVALRTDASQHEFYIGGTERARIDSSGNLGIGTSSPQAKAVVSNSGAAGIEIFTNYPGGGVGTYLQSYNRSSPGYVSTAYDAADHSFRTSGTERMRIDTSGNVQNLNGSNVVYAPAPASISTTATLTNANIQAQIINTTGTTYTVTMPLGTTLETLVPWAAVNLGYNFTILNTASGTITMAANTGLTTLGTLTVLTGVSARFQIRRTAANTFIMYRV